MKDLAQTNVKRGEGGKLFNFRPALFFALWFALGVYSVYLFKTDGDFLLAIGISLALIPVVLFLSKKEKPLFSCALLLLFFAFGVFSAFEETERYDNPFAAGRYEITGKIVDGECGGDQCFFILDELTLNGEKTDGLMRAYFSETDFVSLKIGDRVVFNGEIFPYETDKDAFAYGYVSDSLRFEGKDITDCAFLTGKPDLFSLLRLRLQERLYAGMSDESAAFTYAVLTGNTSGIESGLLKNVRMGGIAHIFAVSGLHIGVLYAFCRKLTDKPSPTKFPRICKFLTVAAVLLFYGGICRFSASVVRATIVCLLLYAADLLCVKSNAIERLGVAMLVCLILSPASLFTAGFLLSFAACFGICVFSRTLSDLWQKRFVRVFKDAGKPLSGFFAVSLSAQAFTAPLSLYFFDYVSVWGLLLNCIFVPLLSLTFSFLLAIGFLACLLPVGAASVLLRIPSTAITGLMLTFHAFDFSFVLGKGTQISLSAFVLYYSFLSIVSDKINLSKGKKLLLASILCLTFLATVLWLN